MKSIRTYLILVSLSVICLVNFLSALNGYRSSMLEADSLLHRQLEETAHLLHGVTVKNLDATRTELFASQSELAWFQIWQGGRLLVRSPLAPVDQQGLLTPGVHRLNFSGNSWTTLVYQQQVDESLSEGESRLIVVAQRADVYQGMMERMVLESILPIVWVLPLLGAMIWGVVSFGMRPLQHLAKLLRSRRVDDFTSLDVAGYPQELEEVVRSTNALLRGLAQAFEREKRFAADAAHELRTPLSALKVQLHNLEQSRQGESEDIRALLQSADRMGHSIEQLLALYRLSPDHLSGLTDEIEMDVLMRQVVVDHYPHIDARQQQVEVVAEPCTVMGERFALQTLIRNLLDNASKYTPEHGDIVLSLQPHEVDGVSGVDFVIEDSGPGIPEGSHGRVFDRFYRLGGDRHASKTIGSGLGLSIVDHIVRLHRGSIALGASARFGGLKVVVWLPLNPLAQAQREEGGNVVERNS